MVFSMARPYPSDGAGNRRPPPRYRDRPVRPAVRYLTVVLVAGAGLALGVVLLAPEVRAFIEAGRAGEGESVLELEELSQRSLVLDREGNVMAVLHAEENRSPVSLERVPRHVVDAILDV